MLAPLVRSIDTIHMRYVILLALILIAVLFYRWRRDRTAHTRASRHPGEQPLATVRCLECGLVIPSSEAVHIKGQPFCSIRHVQAWQARHPR
ncbi:MAG: PP0621 family protein [Pseudomonadota bacterium]